MAEFSNAARKIIPQLPSGGGSALLTIAGLTGVGYGLYNSAVTVEPGHKGVKYSRIGGLDATSQLNPGINLIIPWFQRAIIYDLRARNKVISAVSGSKDLQMVQIAIRVLFKPDPKELAFIYRRLGKDYEERVLPSIINEVTKAVIAQYNASELLTKREFVSAQIRNMLVKRAGEFGILLDDVSITNLLFSPAYAAAVEAKQVAQQDSERAKYVVERAIQEKRTIIIRAEGEAKSAMLIGAAIRDNPAFIQLRRIEAAKEIASTVVSSSSNRVYLNADSLLLNSLGDTTFAEEQKAPIKKTWIK